MDRYNGGVGGRGAPQLAEKRCFSIASDASANRLASSNELQVRGIQTIVYVGSLNRLSFYRLSLTLYIYKYIYIYIYRYTHLFCFIKT